MITSKITTTVNSVLQQAHTCTIVNGLYNAKIDGINNTTTALVSNHNGDDISILNINHSV